MKLIALLVICVVESSFAKLKRNVVIIMADDFGFNDVGFRGSNEIPTPNIDALAYNGVILNRFYTPPICTPSRSSVMTGKYPHRLGMQSFVIPSYEPWGLGKEEKILPQYFKDAGYSTTLIGKWHLGFYQQQYTPTRRGFDSHIGYLGPHIDYFDYTLKDFSLNYERGYDMRRNLTVANATAPIYATNLFTNEAVKAIKSHDKKKPMFLMVNHIAPHSGNEDFPLQAPADEIAKFSNISNVQRRTLAAMISVLDQGVGEVVKALKDNKMLGNTIIVFYSDNGGPTVGLHSTGASNYPLRGQKQSSWEGAIRNNAIVYAPFLKNQGVVRNQLMHVSDLFVTLTKLAGVQLQTRLNLDGVDQWSVINYGGPQVRNEVVNIDDVLGFGSCIILNYKFVNGSSSEGAYDSWLSSKNNNGNSDPSTYAYNVLNSPTSQAIMSIKKKNRLDIKKILDLRRQATVTCSNNAVKKACDVTKSPCLFDIYEDPCEENDLSSSKPLLFAAMKLRYETIKNNIVPSRRKPADPACDPKYFNNTWNWWQEDS